MSKLCTCNPTTIRPHRDCVCSPKLDLSKPVQTRAGLPVRIVCSNRRPTKALPNNTILGLVHHKEGDEQAHHWDHNGIFNTKNPSPDWDLVNIPPKPREVSQIFVICEGDTAPQMYSKKKKPPQIGQVHGASGKIVGFREVTIKEGEGL